MKINIIGATGMVGSRVAAEAASRGHDVIAYSRSGGSVEGASDAHALDLASTAAVVEAVNAADATLITVAINPEDAYQPLLDAHQALIDARPSGRVLVVGGAGSLVVDGVMLKDASYTEEWKGVADTYAAVLEAYRASDGIDWTYLSPPRVIEPGERTGSYVVGQDSPVGEHISAEDFAVAIVDEFESPQQRNRRFTVAN
ncbi:NAD(P)-dependent oxidoreductase [Aestuariimicrobium ganziense]|uniref:NAD(P)-dependent oxidoreductase n=1 Tax=Aestuariimicrobium ganziense TaxID=2773677 RepID=UPI001940FAE8|nr:NAD(P)H-binding protein [Aestuariimicrobium ganziense]